MEGGLGLAFLEEVGLSSLSYLGLDVCGADSRP